MERVSFLLMAGLVSAFTVAGLRPVRAEEKKVALGASEKEVEVKVTRDGTKYVVDPKKLLSGGVPKDEIPSIDDPKFVSVEEADKYIQDNELVLALTYKGVKRVYPLQILVWHEIVNDTIEDDPILVTYCPLCGSGIAFERRIDGEEVEFGVSGLLYNSDLVMYDRKTGSYWSQLEGMAIVGELSGTKLKLVPIDTVVWRDWKNEHPNSEVLDQRTGFRRSYGTDPYGGYYEDSYLMFPVENRDDRIHPKSVIFGVELEGDFKAYQEKDLEELNTIEDTVKETRIRIERNDIGVVTVTNLDTADEIVPHRAFWFAWYAFHPETLLYSPQGPEKG